MNNIFNSNFEISLRLLLTLYITETAMTLDAMIASDFITVYGTDFNLSESNLHGINEFSFSEFTARREQTSSSIKELVLDGFVSIIDSSYGIAYSITDTGECVCDSMTTQYAADYINMSYKVKSFIHGKSITEIIELINRKAFNLTNRRQS